MRNYTEWTKESLEQAVIKKEDIEHYLKELDKKNYVIYEDFINIKDLKKEFDYLYDMIKIGFTIDELREFPIKYRYDKSSPIKTMQLRHFITNMILWYGIIRLGGQIEEEHIIDAYKITAKDVANYYDKYYIRDFKNDADFHELNKAIADTTYELSKISLDFNLIMGMSVTLETYIGTAIKFPRFEEILKNELSTSKLPNETEEIVDALTREQVDIIRQDEDSMIKVFLDSKDGVKIGSLQEFVVASSNKPDLQGNTMPIPITKNFLMGGLGNLINYYIDAVAGRKSIILNKTEMGRSGYFAFLVILNSSDTRINKMVDDCGTVNTLLVDIKTQKHLNMVVGRYYVPERGKLEMITPQHTHLIGKTIRLRSATKCACKKGICKKCIGELADLNAEISIGGYSAILVMLDIQQKILSSKHILSTSSTPIIFNEDFAKYFQIYSNEILLDSDKLNENPESEALSLIIDNMLGQNEDIFDKDLTNMEFDKFYIGRVTGSKRGKSERHVELITEISEVNGTKLSITKDLVNNPKFEKVGDYFHIKLSDIDDELSLFSMEVANNELTKPLYDIKNLLNTNEHNGCTTIDDITNRFFDHIIEAEIDVGLLNLECILYSMIRDKNNIYKRPDFKVHVFDDDVTILSIKSSLASNPSIAVKLASEALKSQLLDLNTYEMYSASFLDDLFRETLLPVMAENNSYDFIDDGLYEDADEDSDYDE